MNNPASRTPVRSTRVFARAVTGLAATGVAVLALGAGSAMAASHHHTPQPRSVGSTLTNTITAPDSNCATGNENGCTTSTVVTTPLASPAFDPEVTALTLAGLGGVGLVVLRRRRTAGARIGV